MTPKVTLLGRGALNIDRVTEILGAKKMVYTTDDGPLLGLGTAIRLIGLIRQIQDPMVQAEILTKAQILLTAFVVELIPLPWDQISSATLSTGLGQREKFDA